MKFTLLSLLTEKPYPVPVIEESAEDKQARIRASHERYRKKNRALLALKQRQRYALDKSAN